MKKLGQKLKRSFRRATGIALASFALVMGGARVSFAQATNTGQPTAPLVSQPARDTLNSDAINDAVLAAARANMSAMLQPSNALARLAEQSGELWRRQPGQPANARILVIESNALATAEALLAKKDTVITLTAEEIEPLRKAAIAAKESLQNVAARTIPHRNAIIEVLKAQGYDIHPLDALHMALSSLALYKSQVLEQTVPFNTALSWRKGGACVIIVQTPSAANRLLIRDLSLSEQPEFTIRHEQGHCLGAKYISEAADANEVDMLVSRHKQEMYSDIFGAGEMVAAGHALDIITRLAKSRENEMFKLQYYTAPGLTELKRRIERMGVDKFKSMTLDERMTVYSSITDRNALLARNVRLLLFYQKRNAAEKDALQQLVRSEQVKSFDRIDLEALMIEIFPGFMRAEMDPHLRRDRPTKSDIDNVIRLEQVMASYERTYHATPDTLPSATVQELQEKVRSWNTQSELVQKAFEIGGEITPLTLSQAHVFLQDSLVARQKEEPNNILYALQMDVLRDIFKFTMHNLDYVGTNRNFGVDLEKSPTFCKIIKEVQQQTSQISAPTTLNPPPPNTPRQR